MSYSSCYWSVKVEGFLQNGPILSISMNGSFNNAQWNFVSDLVTLLATKVMLKLQDHSWGESV